MCHSLERYLFSGLFLALSDLGHFLFSLLCLYTADLSGFTLIHSESRTMDMRPRCDGLTAAAPTQRMSLRTDTNKRAALVSSGSEEASFTGSINNLHVLHSPLWSLPIDRTNNHPIFTLNISLAVLNPTCSSPLSSALEGWSFPLTHP